jgi:nucleotide-binding universal stress UspA family protein
MIYGKRMKNIKKILLPIDGSIPSMKAARYGISIAIKLRSNLVGLTVIDLMSLPYGYFLNQSGTRSKVDVLEEKRRESKEWLEEGKINVQSLDVLKETKDTKGKFRSEILEDPFSKVENAIIKYAENENVDLIVMGSKGRSGFKRTLLGSVASTVLSYARCPVLIVR